MRKPGKNALKWSSLASFLVLLLIMTVGMVGCQKAEEKTTIFESQLGSFTIAFDSKYVEKAKSQEDIYYITTLEAPDGKQIRIVEEKDAAYTVDEAYLEEELTVVDEIETKRTEILDVEGFGKIYGALLYDDSLNDHLFYYKFNSGTTVGTVLFSNKRALTQDDEAAIKTMISTLKNKEK